MTRVSALFVLSLLAATALAGQDWYSGIVKALRGANQLTRFFDALPDSVREPIENTEVDAAAFVCSIMRGEGSEMTAAFAIPEASAIEQEFSTITSFVGAIPSIAADTLSYIVDEGEDASRVNYIEYGYHDHFFPFTEKYTYKHIKSEFRVNCIYCSYHDHFFHFTGSYTYKHDNTQ
ncbi:hypothetical protein SCUP234_08318 [Seiridium cupressi]